jgi:hypothetical protein
MSAGRGLSVRIHLRGEAAAAPPRVADVTHTAAEKGLMVRVGGVGDGHFYTVFNLAPDGQVQLLDPRPALARAGTHAQARGEAIDPFPVEVRPPFGADHIVVVAGERRLNHLMQAVARGHAQFAAAAVLAALEREAGVQPLQAGFKGIYTARA